MTTRIESMIAILDKGVEKMNVLDHSAARREFGLLKAHLLELQAGIALSAKYVREMQNRMDMKDEK